MVFNNFEYTVRSIIGSREEQQDSAGVCNSGDLFLAVVCDGMGGLNGGSAASRTAVNEMLRIFSGKGKESISEMLSGSVDVLDEAVFTLVDESGEKLRSGTTIVSVVIDGSDIYWMSVGDSRLYIFRNSEMVQATRDHNYALYLDSVKDSYKPTEEDIKQSEALVSFIGMGGISVMDVSANPVALLKKDVVLLTTDGLYKAVSEEDINRIVSAGPDIEKIADELLETAEKNAPDTRDNISFIIIRF